MSVDVATLRVDEMPRRNKKSHRGKREILKSLTPDELSILKTAGSEFQMIYPRLSALTHETEYEDGFWLKQKQERPHL